MKKQQEGIMSRFPSNIDAHLRPQQQLLQRSQNPNPNPNPSPNPNPNLHTTSSSHNQTQNAFGISAPTSASTSSALNNNNVNNTSSSSPNPQQRVNRANPAELQMAYHDAWRVCHPDFKRPFTDLEDACERLLPYHVVADYEAEEDDKILDSDSTGQMLSRSQQWDHNIAAKVAEFTATFEKQVLAFNIISRKRELGEFRTEEKLMIEQQLLQEERRALLEMRAEMDSRQKAAMVHADQQSRADLPEMLARAPIRTHHNNNSAVQDTSQLEAVANTSEMNNGWDSNGQKDEKEPSDDFLNDEETENGDAAMQSEWRGGDLDLNAR